MTENTPEIVVVLAAGLGSRLRETGSVLKPLRLVAGRTLIHHVLTRFLEAGIERAVIVTGYAADELEAGIKRDPLPMDVAFVHNPAFAKSNGLSVLAAEPEIGERSFFLSMSDHIFEASLVEGLASALLPKDGLILAVDRKLDTIYDMDDATKVFTKDNRIVAIGKDLKEFDAVDTGLFSCTPALFRALSEEASTRADRDCSLSGGVRRLAARGLAQIHDVGEGLWQDVDTPGAEAHAKKLFGL